MIDDYLYEFSVIVQEGSISDAAGKLALSESALARHLSSLETQLGVRLVERGPAGIRMTEDGRYAFDVAQDMTRLGDSLSAHFQNERMRHHERQVLIGGLSDSRTLSHCLEDACRNLEASGLNLSVRFLQPRTPRSIEKALADHEADVVIAFRRSVQEMTGSDDLMSAKLVDAPAVVSVEKTNPIAMRGSVNFADLQPYTFGRYAGADENMGAMWEEFLRVCDERHFTPTAHTISYESMLGSDWRHPEDVLVYSNDIPFFERLGMSGRMVVPVNDLHLEVFAVTRSDDTVSNRLVLEAARVLSR